MIGLVEHFSQEKETKFDMYGSIVWGCEGGGRGTSSAWWFFWKLALNIDLRHPCVLWTKQGIITHITKHMIFNTPQLKYLID